MRHILVLIIMLIVVTALGPNASAIEIVPTIIRENFLAPAVTRTDLHQEAPGGGMIGLGIAFDGETIWTSFGPYILNFPPETKLYRQNTRGELLGPVDIGIQVGALTFNPTTGHLYGGLYRLSAQGKVYEIDPKTKAVTPLFDLQQSGACDLISRTLIAGLAYQPATNTLYLSNERGDRVFHVRLSGEVISSFPFSKAGGTDCTNAGIAFDGTGLWLIDFNRQILHTDINGVVDKILYTPGYIPHGIAYDDRTFAPECVLWTNAVRWDPQINPRTGYITPYIRAYQVPCAKKRPDLAVTEVQIAQVVWDPDIDGDGRIDLVKDRPVVVRATVTATDVDPTDQQVAISTVFTG